MLTGGGALLSKVDLLAEYRTGMSARVGLPIEHIASRQRDDVSSPIYATAIGLIIHGLAKPEIVDETDQMVNAKNADTAVANTDVDAESSVEDTEDRSGPKWVENAFKKARAFFEATPDQDF